MIALIDGVVTRRDFDDVVLMTTGGVGYRLHVSVQTLAELPPLGERARLHVHTHVREDALQLFGFHDDTEREAFLLLTSVSGVGARLALAILSGFAVPDLASAVRNADVRRLSSVPGVGKKTAERVVLELREKFARMLVEAGPGPAAMARSEVALDDLRSALSNLGYGTRDIDRIVTRVEKEIGDVDRKPPIEELVRLALRLAR